MIHAIAVLYTKFEVRIILAAITNKPQTSIIKPHLQANAMEWEMTVKKMKVD